MAEIKGLVRLRKHNSYEPQYHCSNCGCNRYSPCGCQEGTKRRARKAKREQYKVNG